MIVLGIEFGDYGFDKDTIKAINETLETGSYCEYMYHKLLLTIHVKCENNEDKLLLLMHRSNWGSCGIRMFVIKDVQPDCYTIKMPLMSAINYIYDATPPLLKGMIKESITSIDNIVEILKTYVMEDNNDKQMRLGLFLKHNNLYDYATTWNDNNRKTDALRKITDTTTYHPILAYVDVKGGEFVQYVISGSLNNIDQLIELSNTLQLTLVSTKRSVIRATLVYIKGYATNGGNKTLDKLCDETITECENILKRET